MKYRGRILAGLIAILAGVLAVAPGFAADTDPEARSMEKMQVTSTRTQKNADVAPASVSVITKEDMEIMQVNTIDEALRYETGVFLDRPGGLGDALPATTMRGLPGDERSLVMVDGIPVNDPYSSLVPYNMIDPNAISQIEVVLGPGSALYGGNAMGGTINMITEDPKKLEAGGRLGCGSYNEQKAGAWVGNKVGEKFTYRVTFDWEAQEGHPTQLVTKSISDGASPTAHGGHAINYNVSHNDATGTDDIQEYWVVGDKGDKEAERLGGSLRTTWKTTDTGKLTFLFMSGAHYYGYGEPHSYITAGDGPVYSGRADAGDGKRTAAVNPKNYLAGKGGRTYYTPAFTYQETFGAVDFTGKLSWQRRDSWYTSLTGAANNDNYYNAPGQYVESEDNEYMAEIQGDYGFTWGRKHTLTAGLFFKQGDFDQETTCLHYFNDEDSTYGAPIDMTQGKTRFLAPFLQVEWSLHDQVTVYTGARIDWWWAEDGKAGDPADPTVMEDKDKSAVSPKLSVVWEPVKGATYVRASIAQAFKPPTIYDLFRTWTSSRGTTLYKSNPDLDPETMWNYELGVDQYLWSRKVKLSGTVFYSKVKDLIDSHYIADDVTEKTNVGEVDITGIELGARVYPTNWMQAFANYTWNESEIKEYDIDETLVGKSLLDFPRDLFKAGADFRFWKFQYSLFGTYVGKTHWNEDNAYTDEETYKGYYPHWEWDTKLTFNATDKVQASVAVDNIFDEGEYEDATILPGTTVYGEIRFAM